MKGSAPVRVICFYLPQYHPIPENDRWWGRGFTDWVSVARARPRFRGHHQPRVPADLGFYDLRLEESRLAQAELAARHGIGGFCYYHYWFNGKLLLERPFLEVLGSGKPDLPFCLCWANENWTRSWDGEEQKVLLRQEYESYDGETHLEWLSRAFCDPRYIRVRNAPLFLVYNPSSIPDLAGKVRCWRASAGKRGFELYLCSVLSHQNRLSPEAAREAGFDASVEFFPHPRWNGRRLPGNWLRHLIPRAWNKLAARLGLERFLPLLPVTNVFSYRKLVERVTAEAGPASRTFPCLMPSWDNSARRRTGATVFPNDDPAWYGKWLRHALRRVRDHEPQERIVFINSWNEWAEGCQLEPDLRNGTRFLEETARVLAEFAAEEGCSARGLRPAPLVVD